ncbi:MAG: MarR family winged helix-turn-helix transcriptional regulator [Dermatophilaceae bacterium]
MSAQAGFKNVLARWEIRPLHFLVLMALRNSTGPSQQELCHALGIDSGNMVELLDTLEELGYVTRARDVKDRRRHVVTLMPAAQAALVQIMTAVEEVDRQFLEPLDEVEQRQLVNLLAKLYSATPEAQGLGYTRK